MRADAMRNRERVLKVAEALFAEHGPALEMDEIARHAGVGVGTIYRHFSTKEALLRALLAGPVSVLTNEALGLADSADPGGALFQFLARVVEQQAAKRHLVEVLARGGFAFAAVDFEAERTAFRAALGRLLARAQRAGAVRRDIAATDLVALVKGTFSDVDSDNRRARTRLLAVICDGLRAVRHRRR
jgi:AcrR family transcriptional regulator